MLTQGGEGLVKKLHSTLGRKFSKSKLAEELAAGGDAPQMSQEEEEKVQELQKRLEVKQVVDLFDNEVLRFARILPLYQLGYN